MIRRMTTVAVMGAVGLLLQACAGKKPIDIAAPPTSATPEAPMAAPSYAQQAPFGGSSVTQGSQEDLRAQAGTDTLLFALDSHDLDSEAQAILTRHADWLKRNPYVRVTVEGHCDERGTREYNLALGERRANAAKNFLANQGISLSRMSIISYGKERPAVDGADEAALALNRRAVTVVIGG